MLGFVRPDTGNALRPVTSDADLTGYGEAIGVVIGTDFEAPWPQLAGVGADGSILVLQADADDQTTDVFHADDPVTRCARRRPTSDCRDGRRPRGSPTDT